MNTCDTCKHWLHDEEPDLSYGPSLPLIRLHGVCEHPKVGEENEAVAQGPDGRGRFFRDGVAAANADPKRVREHNEVRGYVLETIDAHTIPLDVACQRSSDDHGLCFITGPKFGCIHHEPK